MANARSRTDSLVWTDDEVELLLQVTLDYKANKCLENIDWESCQSKYTDIAEAFQQQYPSSQAAGGKDFPHDKLSISKTQVTTKLKAIRGKYKQAVHSGRRRGHGRVVLLFFDLCKEIWGGTPAARAITAGIETAEIEVKLEGPSSPSNPHTPYVASDFSYDSPALDSPGTSEDTAACNLPPAVVKKRGDMLQPKLNSHRRKRKLYAERVMQEDLQIKRRMLELMEVSERHNTERLAQIASNIATISNTIQEGFSLLGHLLNPQPPSAEPPSEGHVQTDRALCHACHNTFPLTQPCSTKEEKI